MPIAIRARNTLTRRDLLVRSASTVALAGLGSLAKPYLSRAADRPPIVSGIQSGDVSGGSAVVWARADRPARMLVEYSTAESFKTILGQVSSEALPDHDFTAKVLLGGLPPWQDIFYRARFEDIRGNIRRNPDRAFPHGAGRTRFGLVRLVGRHRGPGLGHRSRPWRHAHLQDHA